jgi:hypothetical protein
MEYSKFSVFWFYKHRMILSLIDLATLKCPYGGPIIVKFIKNEAV